MPKKYSSILFWFDGAFCESLASLTLKELSPDLKGAQKCEKLRGIQNFSSALAVGKITESMYLERAVELCASPIPPEILNKQIIQQAVLNVPLLEIFQEIRAEYDPRIVVDIPAAWFHTLVARWNVATIFDTDLLIFTEKFNLTNIIPDIFYYIPNSIGRNISECIMVDPIQSRAVTAHKLGLTSLPYVYPRRLKIELALQGIWQTDEDVLHPQASSRSTI